MFRDIPERSSEPPDERPELICGFTEAQLEAADYYQDMEDE